MSLKNTIIANFPDIAQTDANGSILGLSVGTITVANVVSDSSNLGPVANLTILGGNAGEYLQTDGLGVLSWTAIQGTGLPGGANLQIQYNNGDGNFAGATGLSYNLANQTLQGNKITVTGNIEAANIRGVSSVFSGGNLDVLGTVNAANIGSNLIPTANVTYDLGGPTNNWNNIYANNATLGNITASGISNLGSNSNVRIAGGSNGQFLTTNGNGILSWANSAVPGGDQNYVQYNNGSSGFAGSAGLVYAPGTGTLTTDALFINTAQISGETTANVQLFSYTTAQANVLSNASAIAIGGANTATVTVGALNVAFTGGISVAGTAPASSADAGTAGQVVVSGDYIYYHTGTQWLRLQGTTF